MHLNWTLELDWLIFQPFLTPTKKERERNDTNVKYTHKYENNLMIKSLFTI